MTAQGVLFLPIAATGAILVMIVTGAIRWKDMDTQFTGGIKLMGFIAFVMLFAGGFAQVLKDTGAVDSLVQSSVALMGGSKLISAAAALGDAGSPASDTTLGPTCGLNADGQHDHIWDTCVPTFLHYNIPIIIAAVLAAQIL